MDLFKVNVKFEEVVRTVDPLDLLSREEYRTNSDPPISRVPDWLSTENQNLIAGSFLNGKMLYLRHSKPLIIPGIKQFDTVRSLVSIDNLDNASFPWPWKNH